MQMKLIKQDAVAAPQSTAAFPQKTGDRLPTGILTAERLAAALWQAMQDYAACLTALTIPGLAEDELKKRETSCLLRRADYLEAKVALEACIGGAGKSTRDEKPDDNSRPAR